MNRPSWDETWLDVARVIARRAACTRSQVGAVIVVDNRYTWLGYNGVPAGEVHCTDGGCPRGQLTYSELPAGVSYDNCTSLHAEQNALLRAGDRAAGGTLYITREPCGWCWKNLRASQVYRVVWLDDQGKMTERDMRPVEAANK